MSEFVYYIQTYVPNGSYCLREYIVNIKFDDGVYWYLAMDNGEGS